MKLITKIVIGVVAAPVLIGTIAAAIGPPTPQQQAAAAQQAAANQKVADLIERNTGLFSAARQEVLANLKDPDSAKFGPLLVTEGGVVCGTVNAKNSFGGFVGTTYFLDDHGLVLLDEGAGAKNFVAYWKMSCVGKQSYGE